MKRFQFGLLACAVLTACGGGSGGGSVAVVSGGGGSSSSPTPTPSAGTLNTGEIKPTADATYLAATMELISTASVSNDLTGQTTGGTTSSRSTTIDTPGFTGRYDATNGYRLTDSVSAASFGPAQLTSDTTATDAVFPTALFTRVTAPVEDYLAIYKKVVTTSSILGSGTMTPHYAGVAGWQHSIAEGAARRTRLDYFGFGPATPPAAMPRAGTVKFSILGAGNYAADTDLYFTNQLDTITVDFGAGTVTGFVSGSGRNFFNGNTGGVFAARVAGTISGNGVAGPTNSDIATASGQVHILFVGPSADELILVFVGQNGRGSYVGAAVGVRNPYLP